MIIKEGSTLQLIEGYGNDIVLEDITAQEDIEIEFNGRGYAVLIRSEGNDENSLFESDSIEKVDEENYLIRGFFKDALMVLRRKRENEIYDSWMNFD